MRVIYAFVNKCPYGRADKGQTRSKLSLGGGTKVM